MPARNGDTPPENRAFRSTLSAQKLRRFGYLILAFRLAAFCFTFASAAFMLTNSRGDSLRWHRFDAFRFVFAANTIVSLYSLFEMVASVWEFSRGVTLFPEVLQVWFDFGHDQVFAYLLLSADSAGTALAAVMRRDMDTCRASSGFCLQADIAIALGFVGFLFLGFSSLLSGFRVACFIINGSRFHL